MSEAAMTETPSLLFTESRDYINFYNYCNAYMHLLSHSGEIYERIVAADPTVAEKLSRDNLSRNVVTRRDVDEIIFRYNDICGVRFSTNNQRARRAEIENYSQKAIGMSDATDVPRFSEIDAEKAKFDQFRQTRNQKAKEQDKEADKNLRVARSQKRRKGWKIFGVVLAGALAVAATALAIGGIGAGIFYAINAAMTTSAGFGSGAFLASVLITWASVRLGKAVVPKMFGKISQRFKEARAERQAAKKAHKEAKMAKAQSKARLSASLQDDKKQTAYENAVGYKGRLVAPEPESDPARVPVSESARINGDIVNELRGRLGQEPEQDATELEAEPHPEGILNVEERDPAEINRRGDAIVPEVTNLDEHNYEERDPSEINRRGDAIVPEVTHLDEHNFEVRDPSEINRRGDAINIKGEYVEDPKEIALANYDEKKLDYDNLIEENNQRYNQTIKYGEVRNYQQDRAFKRDKDDRYIAKDALKERWAAEEVNYALFDVVDAFAQERGGDLNATKKDVEDFIGKNNVPESDVTILNRRMSELERRASLTPKEKQEAEIVDRIQKETLTGVHEVDEADLNLKEACLKPGKEKYAAGKVTLKDGTTLSKNENGLYEIPKDIEITRSVKGRIEKYNDAVKELNFKKESKKQEIQNEIIKRDVGRSEPQFENKHEDENTEDKAASEPVVEAQNDSPITKETEKDSSEVHEKTAEVEESEAKDEAKKSKPREEVHAEEKPEESKDAALDKETTESETETQPEEEEVDVSKPEEELEVTTTIGILEKLKRAWENKFEKHSVIQEKIREKIEKGEYAFAWEVEDKVVPGKVMEVFQKIEADDEGNVVVEGKKYKLYEEFEGQLKNAQLFAKIITSKTTPDQMQELKKLGIEPGDLNSSNISDEQRYELLENLAGHYGEDKEINFEGQKLILDDKTIELINEYTSHQESSKDPTRDR